MPKIMIEKPVDLDGLPGTTTAPWVTPWVNVRLGKEIMDHLWDSINHSTQEADAEKDSFAGNISNSRIILDKDDLFYNSVLKDITELLFYEQWINYYYVHIAKTKPQTLQCLGILLRQHGFVSISGKKTTQIC